MTHLNLTYHYKKQAKIDADVVAFEKANPDYVVDSNPFEPHLKHAVTGTQKHNKFRSMIKADRIKIVRRMRREGLDKHDISKQLELHLNTIENYIREINRGNNDN